MCNLMLGNSGDNPEVLERAAQYLRNYKEKQMSKSDVSRPTEHIHELPKPNHPSKLGGSGTDPVHGKSHGEDVQLGEGLELGAVHHAHIKHKVKEAKHVKGLQMEAQAAHERRENGGADPYGDCE